MRFASGLIAPRLIAAGVLALVLGCGTNSPTVEDEVRVTLNNSQSVVDVSVTILSVFDTTTISVAAGATETDEVQGGVGDDLTFQVAAQGGGASTICQPGSPIVSPANSPQPGTLYGQVDINATGSGTSVNCSGGLGEWL